MDQIHLDPQDNLPPPTRGQDWSERSPTPRTHCQQNTLHQQDKECLRPTPLLRIISGTALTYPDPGPGYVQRTHILKKRLLANYSMRIINSQWNKYQRRKHGWPMTKMTQDYTVGLPWYIRFVLGAQAQQAATLGADSCHRSFGLPHRQRPCQTMQRDRSGTGSGVGTRIKCDYATGKSTV